MLEHEDNKYVADGLRQGIDDTSPAGGYGPKTTVYRLERGHDLNTVRTLLDLARSVECTVLACTLHEWRTVSYVLARPSCRAAAKDPFPAIEAVYPFQESNTSPTLKS